MIETGPFLAVILSAFLHAAWNAIVRSGRDPGDLMVAAVIASGILSLPLLAGAGLPAPAAWPFLLASTLLNTLALRCAMAAYARASFALAYPTMRAATPLLALPLGAWALGGWPRPLAAAGVLLIAASIAMLALAARRAGRAEWAGLGFALLAAGASAAFVTVDAVGVRRAGGVASYGLALAAANAVSMALLSAGEGRRPDLLLLRNARAAAGIGSVSLSSFLLYLWAVSQTPVAIAAALRETSVLFAIAIAAIALREPVGRFHWGAGLLALAGIGAIRLA
ncbi:MAG TPA: EamA family transporter [Salinarimonas sp.]|nr:EamA family transporter [Salinarimonas sp.]